MMEKTSTTTARATGAMMRAVAATCSSAHGAVNTSEYAEQSLCNMVAGATVVVLALGAWAGGVPITRLWHVCRRPTAVLYAFV